MRCLDGFRHWPGAQRVKRPGLKAQHLILKTERSCQSTNDERVQFRIGLGVGKDSEAESEPFENGHLGRLAASTWAQKKQRHGAGQWPPRMQQPILQTDRPRCTAGRARPESRSRPWRAWGLGPETSSAQAADRVETGAVPPSPVPPAPPLTAPGRSRRTASPFLSYSASSQTPN